MIEVQGEKKTPQQIRQQLYENIIEESMFISRASEGAVSLEWVMDQPIFIRKKYVEQFTKELKERQDRMNNRKK